MSWAGVWTYYGLRAPFNFNVAILFLLNLLGLASVLLIGILLFINGALSIGTQRFYFLCYLGILFSTAAMLSRVAKLSCALCCWGAIELSVAFATAILARHGITESLLPVNRYPILEDPRFEYHSSLGRALKANWHGEWHFDRRNQAFLESLGWPVNPEEFYKETFFAHNSLGLRGRELSVNDLMNDLIFIDGGSSTYDFNVTQGLTWGEQLEGALNNKFTIVNFGVPFHSTTQHLINTAFYQSILQKKPVCAIYYVGWNDLLSSPAENLDPTYANYLSLMMVVRKPEPLAARYSPLFRLGYRQAKRRLDTIPELPAKHDRPSAIEDGRLERFFAEHVATITSINNSRGVKTVFIGQIANRELLNLWPHLESLSEGIKNERAWPISERFNSILKITSVSMGAHYIDAGIQNFNNSDFADPVHFSAAGSSKFARLVSGEVAEYCQ